MVDRLSDEVHRVLALGLLPEQREVLADAIVNPSDVALETLPPRLRELATSIIRLLNKLEQSDGVNERKGWAVTIAYDLTNPEPYKRFEDMATDEREHEIERWNKYGPDE